MKKELTGVQNMSYYECTLHDRDCLSVFGVGGLSLQ